MRLKIKKEEGASSPYIEVPGDDITNLLDDIERRSERAKRGEETKKEEGAPYIEVPQDDIAGVLGGMGRRSEGWAISFIRSLEGAPDDVISMLPLSVVEKVLEGAAKSQGDVGTLAKIVLKRLKSCLEEK